MQDDVAMLMSVWTSMAQSFEELRLPNLMTEFLMSARSSSSLWSVPTPFSVSEFIKKLIVSVSLPCAQYLKSF